jgi:hypothetical protein
MNDETLLTTELHLRADAVTDAPLTFEGVRGRARQIQRRRRGGAAAVAAVVVAIVVPVALLSGSGSDRTTPPPVVTPAQTYDLRDVTDTGALPAIPYIQGDQLLRPDDDPLALPDRYQQFHLESGALLGDRNDDSTGDLVTDIVQLGNGKVTDTRTFVGVAVSDDGLAVAEGSPDGSLTLVTNPRPQPLLSDARSPSPVALTGACFAFGGDCRVFYNNGHAGLVVDIDGQVSEAAPGAVSVADATESGLVAVRTSINDDGVCAGVYDSSAASYVWETCHHDLISFSPDGRYVLATTAQHDGIGLTALSVLDAATGRELVTYRVSGDAHISGIAPWEDDGTFLAATFIDGSWSVLRLEADGTRERVLGPTPGEDLDQPFVLPSQ